MTEDRFKKIEFKLLEKISILEAHPSDSNFKKLQALRKKLIKHRLENQNWWKDSTFWY